MHSASAGNNLPSRAQALAPRHPSLFTELISHPFSSQISYTYCMTHANHKITHKVRAILSLVAVFSLLVATIGVPLGQHWCGNMLSSERLYAAAPSCGMEEEHNSGVSLSAQDCCRDELNLLAASGLDNDGAQALSPNPLPLQVDFFAQVITHTLANYPSTSFKNPYLLGSPPELQRDFVVVHHSFLI